MGAKSEREFLCPESAVMRLSFWRLPFTVQPQHERDERSDSRFGCKASHPNGGFSCCQHGGRYALPLGRSFLGRPAGQGSHRRRRPGREPDDYCPGSNTDARGWTTLISQAAAKRIRRAQEVVFNQFFVMSILIAAALGVVGFFCVRCIVTPYARTATTAARPGVIRCGLSPGRCSSSHWLH